MADEMALLMADLYEAAGASRRLGELVAQGEGQSQARWQVLSVLDGPPATVPQIARRLGISRQAVQRVVNELANEGTVAAEDNPGHRSSPLFTLTEAGRTALDRLSARAAVFHHRQLRELPADEVTAARAFLRRFTALVREDAASLR